jgi:Uma2 family endonuclease
MATVSVAVAPPIRASEWDQLSVPEGYRAEVVRGELVVTPGASVDHGRAQTRLAVLLAAAAPAGYEPVSGVEWRLDSGGVVAMAPQPDVMVVPKLARGVALHSRPLLAVEVLSPSDHQLLASGMTRREGKLMDYAANGLEDYLELDLTAPIPVAARYELHDGLLVQVDTVTRSSILRAERPFAYEFAPAALLS